MAFFLAMSYFHSINISAFFSYGYDKGVAWLFPKDNNRRHWLQHIFGWLNDRIPSIKNNLMQRIPESILHWHSACGGTIGAYLGHQFFQHKMRSSESIIKFSPVFNRTALVQAILLITLIFTLYGEGIKKTFGIA
ncbi:MAG TPA: DUF1294 domain-containing protein [Nostocaceae cyanobacterium]|nr:DUF1294 domain-containing protein [Nostocaceae cyanobacterium]